jgi:hypothetical protein
VRPTRDDADLVAGERKLHGEIAPDGPRTKHAYLHAALKAITSGDSNGLGGAVRRVSHSQKLL